MARIATQFCPRPAHAGHTVGALCFLNKPLDEQVNVTTKALASSVTTLRITQDGCESAQWLEAGGTASVWPAPPARAQVTAAMTVTISFSKLLLTFD